MLEGVAQTPTTSASNVAFADALCNRVTVSWTNGNGAARIVVARKGSAVSTMPSTNNYYLAKDSFGQGHQFSTTEYVVYNGGSNSVTVKNLESNTTYYFSVFEYNGAGTVFNYRTTAYPEASVTTQNITSDFSIDDPYQCVQGNLSKFTQNASQSGSNPMTYLWKFGDGQTSTDSNPTHSYTTYGVYSVSLTVSSIGCLDTRSKLDTVAPMPNVKFELNKDSSFNTQQQCFFQQDGRQNRFAFENTSTVAPLGGTFDKATVIWNFGDGTISNNFQGRKTYSSPGTYTVKLVLNSTKNNKDYCADSTSLIVVVKPRPIDVNNIKFSDTVMCMNGNLFYFDHLNNDATATNTWTFGDGASANGRNVSHSYGSPGIYPIFLTVLDTAKCYDEYRDTVEVIPQPDNRYIGLDSNYCQGEASATLVPTISGGTFFGDNVDPSSGQFNPNTLGKNTISYAVNENGCKDTFTRATTVNPLPVFELGSDTSICSGTSAIFSVDKGNSAVSWSNGASDSFTTISSAGLIWAQKSELGCTYRDSLRVSVINAPSAFIGNDSTLCGGGTVEVDVRIAEGEYVWNDGYTEGERIIDESGYFKVVVTNKCGVDSADINLEILSYACDIFIPNAFSPNADNLNDVFRPSGVVQLKEMQIFNRWGELLYTQEGPDLAWDGTYNGERVMQGYYYYLIRYLFPEDGKTIPMLASGEVYLLY
ncbi:MAG: hypothetical protein RLZZ337_1117 [Bacteroidota bacterium]|jgi:gliding motility-associated-like protein